MSAKRAISSATNKVPSSAKSSGAPGSGSMMKFVTRRDGAAGLAEVSTPLSNQVDLSGELESEVDSDKSSASNSEISESSGANNESSGSSNASGSSKKKKRKKIGRTGSTSPNVIKVPLSTLTGTSGKKVTITTEKDPQGSKEIKAVGRYAATVGIVF